MSHPHLQKYEIPLEKRHTHTHRPTRHILFYLIWVIWRLNPISELVMFPMFQAGTWNMLLLNCWRQEQGVRLIANRQVWR